MKNIKVYVAGKVSKDSVFKTHHWRDDFCRQLEELSGLKLENLDPLKAENDLSDYLSVFKKDCQLIDESDLVIVYLSDDISVGGSQEILIAKYLGKPVIGLAPFGGKFNGRTYVMDGVEYKNFKDPFVFSTCDVVCSNIEEVAKALHDLDSIKVKSLDEIIKLSLEYKK